MATVTNTIYSAALRGQSVRVTASSIEAVSKLPYITYNQKATVGSTSKTGYVDSIDIYGMSFQVMPANPDLRFDSGNGILNSGEVITLV